MGRHEEADTTLHCEHTKKCLTSMVKFSPYSGVLKVMAVKWTDGQEWKWSTRMQTSVFKRKHN
jgi:hypothetical protein